MENNLFKRAILFSDLHFGKKNNERQFNVDCENYIKWMIEIAKDKSADCIIFLGDFHDNRNSLHISTLNYSLSSLELLNNAGVPVHMITGNHDQFYKERRELSSVSIARNFSNIHVYNDITAISNVVFFPWLVSDEWKKIPKLIKNSYYVFGHFELPHFMMNALVEMPDHGGLSYQHFDELEGLAFTGHFHKRQSKGKVLYIGNSFPHSYSDAWDDERGLTVLDWGQEPQFINWPDAPNYRTLNLSELLDSPEISLNERTYSRVTTDIDLAFHDIDLIKKVFTAHYSPRKIDIVPGNKEQEYTYDVSSLFQSIDQIVIEGLKSIDSVSMDKSILIDLYNGLN